MPMTGMAILTAPWIILTKPSACIQNYRWAMYRVAPPMLRRATMIPPITDFSEAIRLDPESDEELYDARGLVYASKGGQ